MQKCDCKTGCLIEVWQQKWLLVGSGVAAEMAAGLKDAKVWQQNWLLV
jgi:hypothetical protein